MSNPALETIQTQEPQVERQSAALFLVPETQEATPAERFYYFGEDILADHDDILPQLTGCVVQIDKGIEHPTETLIFDARKHEDGVFVWQVSTGFEGSQKIRQLTATKDGISGAKYATTRQGAFIEAEDYAMSEDEVAETMERVYELFDGEEAQQKIKERSLRKHHALLAVGELSVESYMGNVSETRSKAEQEKIKLIAEGRLARERAKLQSQADAIGLTALSPYELPSFVKINE